MNEGLMTTMPVAPLNQANNDGMFGGNGSWVWIILIFLLLGGRGGGLFGNDGVAASPATNFINNDFLYTQQKIDALGQSILGQTTAINQTLCQGFGDVRMGIAQLGFQNQQCCCDTLRAIDSVNYNASQNTCAITTAIGNSTQAIKNLINGNTMQDLRDDRERWREMYSQANQTNAITGYVTNAINQRFPYPAPANVVGYGYPGFGAGMPYGGFPGYGVPFGGFGHNDGHRDGCCNPCC